ncbi:hypothetical protein DU500_09155 [Haloplanus rubicundus]|uniref:Uncharacterized protein n=1 Tax=Haloplanus rubicundus TaxID=1547898 RepID=A0A345E309_9EURY|nr:hypothetical protein [Haloplanus rubicundus]AXG06581.1 hypothetical protein DU500_09155 [Haloplanus rubicundus]
MVLRDLVETAFSQLGLAGTVSVTVVVGLLLVVTWAHKAAAAGSAVASAGSTAQHDLKVVAALLLVFAVLGVVSINVDRSMTLGQMAWEQVQSVDWGAMLP